MLEVRALTVRYGGITALHGVDLHASDGELVAIVGPNGAGKTTLLSTVAGLLAPAAGEVRLDGSDVTGAEPSALLRRGLALVPEHRRIFKELTVRENVVLAGVTVGARRRAEQVEAARVRFPVLARKWDLAAGFLSGGEAQQLAIARALVSAPRTLLLDEPCLGLAPALVDTVLALLQTLHHEGHTVVVVEQNVRKVLAIADRAYVLRTGTVAAHGTPSELAAQGDLFSTYLGGAHPSAPSDAAHTSTAHTSTVHTSTVHGSERR